jgi:hypothetical protein
MSQDRLEEVFPYLKSTIYSIESPCDETHNCLAYALGIKDEWWDPFDFVLYTWPESLSREYTISNCGRIFEERDYEWCRDGTLEDGFEKVAIYSHDGEAPSHFAIQLPTGAWKSKIGETEDIEHELEALTGKTYGAVAAFMRRRL